MVIRFLRSHCKRAGIWNISLGRVAETNLERNENGKLLGDILRTEMKKKDERDKLSAPMYTCHLGVSHLEIRNI